MKRVIVAVIVACLPVLATANDLRAVITDVSVSADTTAMRVDTAYTFSMSLRGFDKLSFSVSYDFDEARPDVNFDDDTIVVALQTSADKKSWTTFGTDIVGEWLLGGTDTIFNSALVLGLDSIWCGNWGRARFIYSDSLEDSTTAGTKYKEFKCWFLGKP